MPHLMGRLFAPCEVTRALSGRCDGPAWLDWTLEISAPDGIHGVGGYRAGRYRSPGVLLRRQTLLNDAGFSVGLSLRAVQQGGVGLLMSVSAKWARPAW